MKISIIIITAMLTVSAGAFLTGCSEAPEEETAINKGTAFQDHAEGKYGPPGAGGYGPPESVESAEETPPLEGGKEKKELFQNVGEGTSFQDHAEGKYGPPGAGGYGPPEATK